MTSGRLRRLDFEAALTRGVRILKRHIIDERSHSLARLFAQDAAQSAIIRVRTSCSGAPIR
jgi:hypothetical protein